MSHSLLHMIRVRRGCNAMSCQFSPTDRCHAREGLWRGQECLERTPRNTRSGVNSAVVGRTASIIVLNRRICGVEESKYIRSVDHTVAQTDIWQLTAWSIQFVWEWQSLGMNNQRMVGLASCDAVRWIDTIDQEHNQTERAWPVHSDTHKQIRHCTACMCNRREGRVRRRVHIERCE